MPLKPSLLKAGARHAARTAWVILGVLALGIGIVGIFLPLLPTTPLVILTAFAFAKGSPRLRRMITTHRIFGPIVEDWEQNGSIAKPYKIAACASMPVVLLISLAVGVPAFVIVIQVICLGGAAFFVLTRPS